ncbi:MAG: DcrB-related protein [Deltaproteobacteria bacterium]|nr:DcrB-related protein [Deltaproteobacteria bacterium]
MATKTRKAKLQAHSFGKLTVAVPPKWVDNSIITFLGPAGGARTRPNVVLSRQMVSDRVVLGQYADAQRASLLDAGLADLEVIDEGPLTLDGRKLYRVRFAWTRRDPGPDGSTIESRVRQEQYYSIEREGGLALTFTFTCDADEYEGLKETFEQIVLDSRVRV